MHLCPICTDIQQHSSDHTLQHGGASWHLKYTSDAADHGVPSTLELSARSGCLFCEQFWDSLTEQHRQIMSISRSGEYTIWLYWDEETGTYTKLRFVLGQGFNDCPNDLVLDTFELLREDEGTLFTENNSLPTPKTLTLKELVTAWVHKCTQTHEHPCCAVQKTSWLPTRLFYLGDHTSHHTPRLVVTENLHPADLPYVALSYTAQDDSFEGLLHTNIEQRLCSLPRQDLPSIFQSACLVAEALGFRYIWIDAICVIQDSNEDLIRELPMRGQVLQHCSINITATSSDCFVNALEQECKMNLAEADDLQLATLRRSAPQPRNYVTAPENLWSAEMICSPLGRDAGYFQDQLFAPRRLHFGRTQVFWQCTELKACEMFPDRLPRRMLQNPINDSVAERVIRSVHIKSKTKLPLRRMQTEETAPVSWIDVWHELVSHYSQCSSSTRGIKLLGICSVTNELETFSGDTYIAGLWQGNLINDLLWCTDGSPPQRSTLSCAPTWSWASIEGAVTYLPTSDLYSNFVKIIDVHATAIETSIFNEHTTIGYLKLNGYLLKIFPGPFPLGSIFPDCHDDTTEAHHFCLPLRLQKSARGNYLCGLVLRRVEEPLGPAYERLGMFRFREGDEVQALGLERFGEAYVFGAGLGNVVDAVGRMMDITII